MVSRDKGPCVPGEPVSMYNTYWHGWLFFWSVCLFDVSNSLWYSLYLKQSYISATWWCKIKLKLKLFSLRTSEVQVKHLSILFLSSKFIHIIVALAQYSCKHIPDAYSSIIYVNYLNNATHILVWNKIMLMYLIWSCNTVNTFNTIYLM